MRFNETKPLEHALCGTCGGTGRDLANLKPCADCEGTGLVWMVRIVAPGPITIRKPLMSKKLKGIS